MNHDEKIVSEYLSSLGYSNIEYEPSGNIPPDFVLNDEIAVEARRLNQHKSVYGIERPLEDLHFKLVQKLTNIIEDFQEDEYSRTTIVSISYGRPLKLNTKLFEQFKSTIKQNIASIDNGLTVQLNEHLEIRLRRSTKKLSKSIILGSTYDYDSGGFIVSLVYNNLKFVIAEKEEKVEKQYRNYKEWWLVLVDYISSGLDDNDLQQLNTMPKINTIFDRVILISPKDFAMVTEIDV